MQRCYFKKSSADSVADSIDYTIDYMQIQANSGYANSGPRLANTNLGPVSLNANWGKRPVNTN